VKELPLEALSSEEGAKFDILRAKCRKIQLSHNVSSRQPSGKPIAANFCLKECLGFIIFSI
jgi:hypothetical protein